jgi:hypothetical protein
MISVLICCNLFLAKPVPLSYISPTNHETAEKSIPVIIYYYNSSDDQMVQGITRERMKWKKLLNGFFSFFLFCHSFFIYFRVNSFFEKRIRVFKNSEDVEVLFSRFERGLLLSLPFFFFLVPYF